MDYKQKYREETNKEPYKNVEHKHNFTLDYVKWLEKQLALCNVVERSEQLRSSCDWCNGNNSSKSDNVSNITDIG